MKLHLITVGEPKLAYARLGWDEYATRLKRYRKLRFTHLPNSTPEREGQAIMRFAGNAPLMALDPRGQQFTSPELAAYLERLALGGVGELALCVGGPDGLSDEVRAGAKVLWSLSTLTFPHDLAMVVVLEALYRASSISKGEPYHR
ncbi:23S rRNA (pseudouridine(1915)-N(3))-methyltransferase RlmH [Deinococcus peraridilitoris]|nr:23S rRNA (pseudouridine(1915)-N(3))-methyltransferase RlmH [Deinococcus peraridilitoris]